MISLSLSAVAALRALTSNDRVSPPSFLVSVMTSARSSSALISVHTDWRTLHLTNECAVFVLGCMQHPVLLFLMYFLIVAALSVELLRSSLKVLIRAIKSALLSSNLGVVVVEYDF